MRIEIQPRNSYIIQNSYRPAPQDLSFRGDAEDEFINSAANGEVNEDKINDYISEISTFGVVSKPELRELLLAFVKRLSVGEDSIKTRNAELDKREKELKTLEQNIRKDTRQNETENIRQELLTEMANRTQALDAREKELDERFYAAGEYERLREIEIRAELEQELAKRKKELDHEEQELMERLMAAEQYFTYERDNIASAIRTQYDIKDPEIKEYVDLGEQMLRVAQVINKHSDIFDNPNRSTSVALINILKNNNGHVPADMLDFLDKIFTMKEEKTDLSVIQAIVDSVKDNNAYLDIKKAATFIGTYSLKPETYVTTLEFMKQTYFSGPEYAGKLTAIDEVIKRKNENSSKSESTTKKPSIDESPELKQAKMAADILEERQKIKDLAKKINSIEILGEHLFAAHINEDYTLDIICKTLHFSILRMDALDCDVNWALEHINSTNGGIYLPPIKEIRFTKPIHIKRDLTYEENTQVHGLEYVTCNYIFERNSKGDFKTIRSPYDTIRNKTT